MILTTGSDPSLAVKPLEITRDLKQGSSDVLFIDADLSTRRATRLLRLEKRRGFADLLFSGASFDHVARFHRKLGFSVVPAGATRAHDVDREALRALLTALEAAQDFDHVVIDAGPLETYRDDLGLHNLADDVILLAPDWVKMEKVKAAVAFFKSEGAAIRTILLSKQQREAA